MKKYKTTMAVIASCLLLSGCSVKGDLELVPATDENESAPDLSESRADNYLRVNGDIREELSEKAINYGYSTKDRDEKNRPRSCLENEAKYSKYAAHFIGDDENVIYLTFDQGYENGYTERILDTLHEKNVKAVFFVTGHYVTSNPELINRMIEDGHAIGNHSYSHPAKGLPSLSKEKQISDTLKLHNLLKDTYGYECTLYRFPAGIYSETCMANIQEVGYTSLFWSFAYKDWVTDSQPDETQALNKMVSQLHPGAVYLLHAVSKTNAAVLGDFIDAAREKGYEIRLYEA